MLQNQEKRNTFSFAHGLLNYPYKAILKGFVFQGKILILPLIKVKLIFFLSDEFPIDILKKKI